MSVNCGKTTARTVQKNDPFLVWLGTLLKNGTTASISVPKTRHFMYVTKTLAYLSFWYSLSEISEKLISNFGSL
jgi:hypothetical protein